MNNLASENEHQRLLSVLDKGQADLSISVMHVAGGPFSGMHQSVVSDPVIYDILLQYLFVIYFVHEKFV